MIFDLRANIVEHHHSEIMKIVKVWCDWHKPHIIEGMQKKEGIREWKRIRLGLYQDMQKYRTHANVFLSKNELPLFTEGESPIPDFNKYEL